MYHYLIITVIAAAGLSAASCAAIERAAPIVLFVLSDADIVWIMNAERRLATSSRKPT
jgi:hypothetical protein